MLHCVDWWTEGFHTQLISATATVILLQTSCCTILADVLSNLQTVYSEINPVCNMQCKTDHIVQYGIPAVSCQ
jgi:hypothetical protein